MHIYLCIHHTYTYLYRYVYRYRETRLPRCWLSSSSSVSPISAPRPAKEGVVAFRVVLETMWRLRVNPKDVPMGGRGWERGPQSGCGAKHRGRIAAVLLYAYIHMYTHTYTYMYRYVYRYRETRLPRCWLLSSSSVSPISAPRPAKEGVVAFRVALETGLVFLYAYMHMYAYMYTYTYTYMYRYVYVYRRRTLPGASSHLHLVFLQSLPSGLQRRAWLRSELCWRQGSCFYMHICICMHICIHTHIHICRGMTIYLYI